MRLKWDRNIRKDRNEILDYKRGEKNQKSSWESKCSDAADLYSTENRTGLNSPWMWLTWYSAKVGQRWNCFKKRSASPEVKYYTKKFLLIKKRYLGKCQRKGSIKECECVCVWWKEKDEGGGKQTNHRAICKPGNETQLPQCIGPHGDLCLPRTDGKSEVCWHCCVPWLLGRSPWCKAAAGAWLFLATYCQLLPSLWIQT